MNEQVLRRRIERHCAATIRAISDHPGAEYRRQQLFLEGRAVTFRVPHLTLDGLADSIAHCRGVADGIALRLTFSNRELHQSLAPEDSISILVFDILEQLRVESLVSKQLPGINGNLDHAFEHWCQQCRGNGLIENELGLLIFSITQIVRTGFNNEMLGEAVETIIESVRFRLAPVVGHDLVWLRKSRHDQKEYSVPALRIAESELCVLLDRMRV